MTTTVEVASSITWVGGDVSADEFDVCFWVNSLEAPTPASLKRLKVSTFERSVEGVKKFAELAGKYQGVHLVLESTGRYSSQLAQWVLDLCPGAKVCIVNPRRIVTHGKTIGLRNKTDAIDARLIASYAAHFRPSCWVPNSEHYQTLQSLTRSRQKLVEQLTAHRNHMADLERQTLCDEDAAFLKQSLSIVADALQSQIQAIEAKLERLVEEQESIKKDVELADSIPGVGALTAVTLLAELGDLRRFKSRKQLEVYAGVNVGTRKSGRSLNTNTGLAKEGSARVRRSLYLAAMAAIRSKTNCFRDYYEQLRKRNKPKKLALGAIMRKILVTLRRMLITNTPFSQQMERI